MELNSFILSAEVENFRMRQKLEKLSTVDLLTGVLNRNAMNSKMQELERDADSIGHGLGAVFVDLNGLKVANDSRGHDEGDEMLRSIADKLKSVYGDRDVYRVGGDEFLVIKDDMDREEFFEYFKRLESLSRVPGEPTFALGAHYDDKEKDIGKIIHIADQNMYKNKAQFYETNPEYDRREV
nr:GGDEF domain-containing protein [Lachnospiraceae bacterium]